MCELLEELRHQGAAAARPRPPLLLYAKTSCVSSACPRNELAFAYLAPRPLSPSHLTKNLFCVILRGWGASRRASHKRRTNLLARAQKHKKLHNFTHKRGTQSVPSFAHSISRAQYTLRSKRSLHYKSEKVGEDSQKNLLFC